MATLQSESGPFAPDSRTVRCRRCGRQNRVARSRMRAARCGNCHGALAAGPVQLIAMGGALLARGRRSWSQSTVEARARFLLLLLEGAYIGVLAALSAANAAGPERWWVSTANLYLPQWYWGLPAAGFFLVDLVLARRRAWLHLIAVAWVAGPMMGLRLALPRKPKPPGQEAGIRFRVMSYNTAGRSDHWSVARQIADQRADLVFLQEAVAQPGWPSGWQEGGFNPKIGSRFPLSQAESLRFPTDEWRPYTRCRAQIGGVTVHLYGIHLETPRGGLRELLKGGGVRELENEIGTRLVEAGTVRSTVAGAEGPSIVAGDFNAPVQSLICRSLLNLGLSDAFSEAGWGYGYTYGRALRVGFYLPYVRIDHMLVSRHFRVLRCWTGEEGVSDHRPVVADLWLPAAAAARDSEK